MPNWLAIVVIVVNALTVCCWVYVIVMNRRTARYRAETERMRRSDAWGD